MSARRINFRPQGPVHGTVALILLAIAFAICQGATSPAMGQSAVADSVTAERPVFPSTPT